MTPAEMELARELARHADLSTLPGAYLWSLSTGRYQRYAGSGVWVDDLNGKASTRAEADAVLVLSDPATWGALLARLPPSLDIAADAVGVSILMFTGAGYVTASGDTWGEAVARAWLATRGAK